MVVSGFYFRGLFQCAELKWGMFILNKAVALFVFPFYTYANIKISMLPIFGLKPILKFKMSYPKADFATHL